MIDRIRTAFANLFAWLDRAIRPQKGGGPAEE